jgi:hypothetical protein
MSWQIKCGVTRRVLLAGNYAFKVPNWATWKQFLYGLLSNMQERAFSRLGWPILCPVLFSDPLGFLVIMPRCDPAPDACLAKCLAELETPYDWEGVPTDDKSENFGYLAGQLVVIDYGEST